MYKMFFPILIVISLYNTVEAQSHKIIESNSNFIKIEFNFENAYTINEQVIDGTKFNSVDGKSDNIRKPGDPWLPDYRLSIGIPHNADLKVRILNITQEKLQGIFILPTPDSLSQPFSLLDYNPSIYSSNEYFPSNSALVDGDFVMRYARIVALSVAPYQFNPVTRELLINKKIIIQIDFGQLQQTDFEVIKITDKMTDEILKTSVINYDVAQNFISKRISISDSPALVDTYWYNPLKDYYKIFLNEKGVYRVTYDWLVNSGVPSNTGLQEMRLELFCNGESIPIDVVDVNQDNLFNSGDYFQFVGEPAKPVNQYTRINIYNRTNVYWFSYQADSLNYYKNINGYPTNYFPIINTTIETFFWEEDRIFNNFGHADNDHRDYWYGGFSEIRGGVTQNYFEYHIIDSIWSNFNFDKPQVILKVGLHGLTTPSCPTGFGHNARVIFNGHPLGSVQWNGQNEKIFNKTFYLSPFVIGGDTAWINVGGIQQVIVDLPGGICDPSQNDMVLINNIELQYWRWNKSYPNHFFFTSPPNDYQENVYQIWDWWEDNMKIYIPSRGEFISNPHITNDQYHNVYFMDTISTRTDYYCVADDYYSVPDSITHDTPSDLRATTNGADYIIITHSLFGSAAERLAEYRSSNLPGFNYPRVKIINVDDIYKEFSFGLLDPLALQFFVKYAFENWVQPAPYFVVLLGDASHDTRKILANSRENFVPSIPYHASAFGRLPSDNLIVAVSGTDLSPDLALGRLSCETVEQANALVDKIISYPSDNSKLWKENVLLLASGLSYTDQIAFGFNNASKQLESLYLRDNGINTTKVFNFPEPQDIAFLGSGPRMREEINKGAVMVNYYGHGGGAQWDLIFTKDDLYELNNGGKLPLALSITCYTAHFDNADAFGEVFVRLPNKGAIGFWGSVGLTWWSTGQALNRNLFNQIFNFKNYVIGKAILSAKAGGSGGFFDEMIAQLSFLGDPAIELTIPKYPDFQISASDISILPANPLVEDTVQVSIKIKNLGVVFRNDSVTVQLFKNIINSENLLAEVKRPSFGDLDSLTVPWIPTEAGLYTLIVVVNEMDTVWEIDHSDNIASASFAVYSFGEPNIIKPLNGFYNSNGIIEFSLVDIGSLFDRTFSYQIEIDTSFNFNSPLIVSPPLIQSHQIVNWQSPNLNPGEYLWRAVVYDVTDTNYSVPRSLTITADAINHGYLAVNKLLKLFSTQNVNYDEILKGLVLNTELKPPHPRPEFYLDSLIFSLPDDSTRPSVFTTDGTYLYYSSLPVFTNGVPSKIYKIGTGLNGTISGHNYGSIPNSGVIISSSLMYHNNSLYTYSDSTKSLIRIDPINGDVTSVNLIDSLLFTETKPSQIGGVYLYSDGEIIYNLAIGTAEYPDKFVLRLFDPVTWTKIGEDLIFNGSTVPGISSFIVVDGYMIVYENIFAFYLRRYRLIDQVFEEEWNYTDAAKDFYAMTYDHINNFIYFANFRPGVNTTTPAFIKYQGTFKDAAGSITSQDIGPASSWNQLNYDIDDIGSLGTYNATLLGRRKSDQVWETLAINVPQQISIDTIDAVVYDYLRFKIDMVDSSFGASEPLKFKSLKVNYTSLPEIVVSPDEYSFSVDTTLQGLPVEMQLKVRNVGYTSVDSLRLDVFLNNADTVYFSRLISVKPDSIYNFTENIVTDKLLYESPVSKIALKVIAKNNKQEFYTFNNIVENQFYVSRDSLRPLFSVTFDGQEIIDGDIISAKPEIVVSLEDNSPLPLTENMFTLIYTENNKIPRQLNSATDMLQFSSTLIPNTATYRWTPDLADGRHKIEILAKDSSGNYFDTTSYSKIFYVYNQASLEKVYNFPNPFKDDTYFTFELRGFEQSSAENVQIKVFTVAGRLIKDFIVPASQLQPGLNRLYWDGKDQDGDFIANGLYFYKVIARLNGETKTVTQKLAKLK